MSNTTLTNLVIALSSVGVNTCEVIDRADIFCAEVVVSSEAAAVAIRDGLKGSFFGRSYRYEGIQYGQHRFVVSVSYGPAAVR